MRIKKEYGEEITFIIGIAIPLTTAKDPLSFNEELLPHSTEIYHQLLINSQKYNRDFVVYISIRIFYVGGRNSKLNPILKSKILSEILYLSNLEMFDSSMSCSIPEGYGLSTIPIINKKKTHLKTLIYSC